MHILNLFFGPALICFLVYTVIWNIARLIYFIKCFKVKKCSNRNCKMSFCCGKYEEVLTKEEAEQLLKLIEEMSN